MDLTAVVLLGLAGIGVWVWTRRRRSVSQAEHRLLQICLGDHAQAERLIDVECVRSPDITRAEAIERAVARHERDNR